MLGKGPAWHQLHSSTQQALQLCTPFEQLPWPPYVELYRDASSKDGAAGSSVSLDSGRMRVRRRTLDVFVVLCALTQMTPPLSVQMRLMPTMRKFLRSFGPSCGVLLIGMCSIARGMHTL